MNTLTIDNKRKQFTQFLLKELGTAERVKEFSQILRDLDICDLRDDKQFENATKDGAVHIMSLLTYLNFGFLDKLKEIKTKIQEK